MQFIFRIPSRFMTVFFGFDPCVTIYYEILFRKSEKVENLNKFDGLEYLQGSKNCYLVYK